MNHDGKMDLLTGCFEGGVYLLEGLGDGAFAEAKPVLNKEGAWLRIGAYWDYEEKKWTQVESSNFSEEHGVSAHGVDWDEDGDVDLILGTRSGGVFLSLNEGSAAKAAFAVQCVPVQAKGGNLVVPDRDIMVEVADWDLDGRSDLLAGGSSGGVYWYRNEGKPGAPDFAEADILLKPSSTRTVTGDIIRPGMHVQISVGDYNSDGRPDLLVGDQMSVAFQGPDPTPEQQTRIEELREETNKIYKEMSELRRKLEDGAGNKEEIDPAYDKLMAKVRERQQELITLEPRPSRHGWVWLFERK